jgi:hypothetical protein
MLGTVPVSAKYFELLRQEVANGPEQKDGKVWVSGRTRAGGEIDQGSEKVLIVEIGQCDVNLVLLSHTRRSEIGARIHVAHMCFDCCRRIAGCFPQF